MNTSTITEPLATGTLQIDLSSPTPTYRQIVDGLRTLLVAGRLRPGDALPPVRQIAMDLGIHFNTVAEAYRILAQEGWLDLRRRRGALVIERTTPEPPGAAEAASFTRRVSELVAETQAAGIPKSRIAQDLRTLAEGLEK
jgi:GntR family transcriptional regulator